MKTLSPSILAADMLNLGNEINKIENSGAEYVHIDIMDGVFVPNISFGMPIISAVRRATDLVLDVHLMITQPSRYFDEFIKCGADIITFHLEALSHDEILNACDYIHSRGKRVGISIKPNTPASSVFPYLDLIDMVLVMTVEPGFGGQSFMYEMIDKIKEIREMNKTIDIQVDGGINAETIKIVNEAGANIFVLGSAFFKSDKLLKLREMIDEK